MPNSSLRPSFRAGLAALALAVAAMAPAAAVAQVVVVANGSPITAYDIEQRTKLMATSTHKTPTRQEVIQELIDDRLKIAKAKSYGFEISDTEVEQAYDNMAKAQHVTTPQFSQMIERSGIAPSTIKARIRAELTWQQLIRGKYSSSLQVGDSDIANALKDRNESETAAVGYVYTLYPVMIVVPRGSNEGTMAAKRSEAENLRGRFVSCNEGLAMARGLRDVAVREPVTRSSADLSPQLRDLLGNMQVGRLTTPEVTAQGLQMFAVCNKKESTTESPLKRELREQIFTKRFESESKKYLDEIRKSAMIEYKNKQ
ncbi:MAG: SurA N-terminal domain-containing protein [Terriglobia bacterium]